MNTQPTPDLDAIAREAFHSWVAAPSDENGPQFIARFAREAIAQDRKTREQEIKPAVEELERLIKSKHEMSERAMASREADIATLRQQLAQQSAARRWISVKDNPATEEDLPVWYYFGDSFPKVVRFHAALFNKTATHWMRAEIPEPPQVPLAQLAEAPREANRALTSGEAVEAAEIIDQLVFAAENADQDGYVTDVGFINVDELHAKARDMATKLRAPSRTEREDTAPEVGGEENQ